MNGYRRHIFEESACLNKRQLREYSAGKMVPEECYALEHHLNGCAFCREAVEGLTAHKAVGPSALNSLSHSFIHEHFSLIHPQVHLNSIAPAVQAQTATRSRRRAKTPPVFKASNLAAAILLIVGVMWYLDFSKDETQVESTRISQPAKPEPPMNEAALPVVVSDSLTNVDTATPAAEIAANPPEQKPVVKKTEPVKKRIEKRAANKPTEAASLNTIDTASEIVVKEKQSFGTRAVNAIAKLPKLFSKKKNRDSIPEAAPDPEKEIETTTHPELVEQ